MTAEKPKEEEERTRWIPADFFDLSNWIDAIAPHTFPSKIVGITLEEAWSVKKYFELCAFLLLYHEITREDVPEEVRQSGKLSEERMRDGWRPADYEWVEAELRSNPEFQYQPNEWVPLETLTAKIQRAIEETGATETGAFVKLSSRSGKDAALWMPTTERLIAEMVEEAKRRSPAASDEEAQVEDIQIFFRAITEAMRVTSGEQAMRLILRSTRCHEDISQAELHGHNGSLQYQSVRLSLQPGESSAQPSPHCRPDPADTPFCLHIVVRSWCPEIDPLWEFRCFVSRGHMTAITQYAKTHLVPGMHSQRHAIADRIRGFWADHLQQPILLAMQAYDSSKIAPAEPLQESYTIDFALSPDLARIWVVEINSPPPVAGTSLFRWKLPSDRDILDHGPFEIRIRDTLPPNAFGKIHRPLRQLINQLRGRDTHAHSPTLQRRQASSKATLDPSPASSSSTAPQSSLQSTLPQPRIEQPCLML